MNEYSLLFDYRLPSDFGDNDGKDFGMDIAETSFWSLPFSDDQAKSLSILGAEYPQLD
jgi:hypothetical protein